MASVRPLVGDSAISQEVLEVVDRVRGLLNQGGMEWDQIDAVPGLEPPGTVAGSEQLGRDAPLSGVEVAWLAEKLGAVVPAELGG